MRENDKGFSIIELIVVIVMIAVLSAGMLSAIHYSGQHQVRLASDLITEALGETKTDAMSRSQSYLAITRNADGTYWLESSDHKVQSLSEKGLTITCWYGVSGTAESHLLSREVTEDEPLKLSFDRASGAFLPMLATTGGSTYTYETNVSGEAYYCSKIVIQKGSRQKTITLVKDTGKFYVE